MRVCKQNGREENNGESAAVLWAAVVAKKRPRGGLDGSINSVKKLLRREISSKRDRGFSMSDAQERFRNIRLQEPVSALKAFPQQEPKRSKIIEIVAARDIVFALAQSGVCAAFSRETNERICFLNVSLAKSLELILQQNNDSLITVSVYASDNFSSLKCRTTRIGSESLKWPGFVEFDDVNGKVLTYSAQDSIYKVFDLKNYTMLYSISDKNVQEIKISVPLKILSIEDGTVLKSFTHLLHRNKKVDFIEQFNEKLLVKQENENLQILDVRNSVLTEVSRTEFMAPSAFIFYREPVIFDIQKPSGFAVWNFRGSCGLYQYKQYLDRKCLAKIKASNGLPVDKCSCTATCGGQNCNSRKRIKASRIRSTVAEALEDITALFYDEDEQIYTDVYRNLGFSSELIISASAFE
ncbi:hypothetical protein DH2020_044522 [Rehmannia glutinosa]|uniref:Uncharacterized protein n=1 Tax=Rehmannia glutinosa TaxID=99300 RepID=A0ABR0UHF4_REHGL